MTNPRVLVLIPSGRCFGLQNLAFDYIDSLSTRVDFSFVLSRWSDGEFLRRVSRRGLPYRQAWLGFISRSLKWVNLGMTFEGLSRLPLAWLTVIKAIQEFRPQAIWMSNCQELILLWPLLLLLRVKVLCHMHDTPPSAGFYRWCYRLWSLPVRCFVAGSHDAAAKLMALGCPPSKVQVIQNGIKLERFPFMECRGDKYLDQFNLPAEAFIVGMTGQMIANKGHEDLIRACAMVRESDSRIRVLIGGRELDSAYGQYLKALVQELKMDKHILFSGWLEDVREFYHNLDLLVMPSRHEEGFGLVAAEAIACGCPVVAADSGGLREVLDHGRAGVIIPPRCPGELARVVLRWMQNPKELKSSRLVGRAHIEEKFNLDRQAALFRDSFISVISGKLS